ncbi:MAG: hypothetical protein C4289_09565 [Chloroflexota bacterium]
MRAYGPATPEDFARWWEIGVVPARKLFPSIADELGLGHDLGPVLAAASRSQVFRRQGWISAVVLVDGYVRGIWAMSVRRAQTAVRVRMFSSPTASVRQGIEAEVERLSAFLNTQVALEYVS